MKKKLLVFAAAMMLFCTMPAGAGYIWGSGQCGNDMNWTVSRIDEGIYAEYLMAEFTGTGDMWNFGPLTDCNMTQSPLKQYSNSLAVAVMPEGMTSIGSYTFYWCQTLQELTIPSTVTKIGDCAFRDCRYLEDELVLPAGLTELGEYAFYNCWGLASDSLVIPEGITKIGDGTFSGCRKLTGAVYIPAGVLSIGKEAFDRTNITDVYFTGDAPAVEDGALPEGVVIHYPADVSGWTENEAWSGYTMESWNPGKVSLSVSQEITNGAVSVSIRNDTFEKVSGRLVCASYGDNGEMLAVGVRSVSVKDGKEENFTVQISKSEIEAGFVRAFFMDEYCVPIADAA